MFGETLLVEAATNGEKNATGADHIGSAVDSSHTATSIAATSISTTVAATADGGSNGAPNLSTDMAVNDNGVAHQQVGSLSDSCNTADGGEHLVGKGKGDLSTSVGEVDPSKARVSGSKEDLGPWGYRLNLAPLGCWKVDAKTVARKDKL